MTTFLNLTWPAGRAGAEAYVADLKTLDTSVDAGIVPGMPSCLGACQHRHGCERPSAVYIGTWDALTGERITWEGCYVHGFAFVRWLLEDPDRRRHQEPPHIDVEVLVIPGRQVAYEWTGWAHRLDSLLRSTPDVPHITYLDELGERVEIPLLANADIRDVVTELLVDAITRAGALAAELKRHSTIAMRKSTEAAQTLSPDVQERAS